MVQTFVEVALAELLPLGDFVRLFLLELLKGFLHALSKVLDQLYGLPSDYAPHLFLGNGLLVRKESRVESLDKRKVLLSELFWLVGARLGLSTLLGRYPGHGCSLLLSQLRDDSFELQNLVIERVHLILVLE